jgi:hypothetical protein
VSQTPTKSIEAVSWFKPIHVHRAIQLWRTSTIEGEQEEGGGGGDIGPELFSAGLLSPSLWAGLGWDMVEEREFGCRRGLGLDALTITDPWWMIITFSLHQCMEICL